MPTERTAVADTVPISIFDLTPPECRHLGEPGHYWSIPVDDEDRVHRDEIVLFGPFPTHEEALQNAREFILDALTDHARGIEEQPQEKD